MTKQKSLQKSLSGLLFTAKVNIAGGNVPYFPLHGPNHLQLKFYTIMQDSKPVLGFNCKRRVEQLNFFDWLSNVKNLVLSNGCELVRNVIQRDLNSFFSKKLQKSPAAGGFAPRTP